MPSPSIVLKRGARQRAFAFQVTAALTVAGLFLLALSVTGLIVTESVTLPVAILLFIAAVVVLAWAAVLLNERGERKRVRHALANAEVVWPQFSTAGRSCALPCRA